MSIRLSGTCFELGRFTPLSPWTRTPRRRLILARSSEPAPTNVDIRSYINFGLRDALFVAGRRSGRCLRDASLSHLASRRWEASDDKAAPDTGGRQITTPSFDTRLDQDRRHIPKDTSWDRVSRTICERYSRFTIAWP
ncbi:hypothetical protein BDZ89DRAFT_280170 [Hymenopellis radicata]|nr:hypothetical protein BDZ89DRAFT_280170 [Hymenopellis radicata]